jgi:PAT family acetyl-CoA transporter-like MFS transporter 1
MKRRNNNEVSNKNTPKMSTIKKRTQIRWGEDDSSMPSSIDKIADHSDTLNYALLIALYTLQGIPMGLSASIPFLLQEKITKLTSAAASEGGATIAVGSSASIASAQAASYNANALFALCSWPFSLKLLWAPVVDAIYFKRFGRRKSWLVPVQLLAGALLWGGANFVEDQLGLDISVSSNAEMNIKGVTTFFFCLYFLMATQDIAVDGWALTMLKKENRGKGPICNSIGQNIGYFLSFVGFLGFNDIEASETLWRPLLGLSSNPTKGMVSLKGFLKFMGGVMLITTMSVAFFKRELPISSSGASVSDNYKKRDDGDEEDGELDAAELGLKETYRRLWAVCRLPSVRMLFLILVTYRLPTALSDNVKFLKAVQMGMSKSTTALLSPTVILPLGIVVPIAAHHIWHKGGPLRQFVTAYKWRVTVIPVLDVLMLYMVRTSSNSHGKLFWLTILASTAGQAICNSLQFNAQMVFFASRVDPAIGGSYMTLLNTAANLGGTWPSSFVMGLLGFFTKSRQQHCADASSSTSAICNTDPYYYLQGAFSVLGIGWLLYFSPRLQRLATLPDDAWRTNLLGNREDDDAKVDLADVEHGALRISQPMSRGVDIGRNQKQA